MHGGRVKSAVVLGSVLLTLAMCAATVAEEAEESPSVADDWESVAVSREGGGATQREQAEQLEGLAEALRAKDCLYEIDRKSNLCRAGEAEKKAGDLFAGTWGNYARAARNWQNAADEHTHAGNSDAAARMAKSASAAWEKASAAAASAAAAYARGADAYAPDNGGDAEKAQQVAAKALQWRGVAAP